MLNLFNEKVKEIINGIDDMEEYLDARKKGAQDAADKAKAKGGNAMPTFYHFDGKVAAYEKCYKIVKSEKRLVLLHEKYSDTMKKLKKYREMSQKTFQKIVGELEVWGEIYLKIKTNDK